MANVPSTAAERWICLGVIVGARGLRGLVWIKPFTADPADVAAYGPVTDASGARSFRLQVVEAAGERVLARIEGIGDRTAAESLKGIELYVSRAALPPPDDEEFYYADLIGLTARLIDADGAVADTGRVCRVHDFGGGSVLEVEGAVLGPILVPFTRAAVPEVDLVAGHVVIAFLPGMLSASNDDSRPAAAETAITDGGDQADER